MADFILMIAVYGLILCLYLAIKNENTFRQHIRINRAIHDYLTDCAWDGKEVDLSIYDRMCSYGSTLWRLLDWGYTNILPPEDFEKIKKYIKKN